jgi:hypothetical protein
MQQFHQTRFIRKTFCQRLIERYQTESMLPCRHGVSSLNKVDSKPMNNE